MMFSNLSYENFRLIFLVALIACGVMAAVTVVLFFVLKIPKVISDLTGRTARKAIEDIRKQNEETGDKTFKSSAVNAQRGKLTDKISPSGRLQHREPTPFGTGAITQKISTSRLAPQEPASETTVLSAVDETTVLSSECGETSVLSSSDFGETTVLGAAETAVQTGVAFTVEYEITYIHTGEVIA